MKDNKLGGAEAPVKAGAAGQRDGECSPTPRSQLNRREVNPEGFSGLGRVPTKFLSHPGLNGIHKVFLHRQKKGVIWVCWRHTSASSVFGESEDSMD